jgi:hypothetical protein
MGLPEFVNPVFIPELGHLEPVPATFALPIVWPRATSMCSPASLHPQLPGKCVMRSPKASHFRGDPPTINQEILLMLNFKTVLRIGKVLVGSLVIAGLAGPAFAGNVWSWRTEDGSFAFTDDSKRIPAKHRAEAKRKSMGKLTRYERFTKLSADVDQPYADRIHERRSELRERTAAVPMGAVAVAPRSDETGLAFSVSGSGGRYGDGTRVLLPLAGNQTASDDEPTTIESVRVKPRHSMATRHFTVVKKGDRVVSVIKNELNQRGVNGTPESDFDQ